MAQFLPRFLLFLLFGIARHMLVQWGGRILSILGVCSFLAARLCYCYLIFYNVWAEPLLIVLLSKIMGGDCDAMIFAAAQVIFWLTRVFGVCSECLFVLTRFTCRNTFAVAQAIFWPTRVFGVCSCVDAFYLRKPEKIPYVLVSTCACSRG